MKKILNILLLLSFIITIMVPVTGIPFHKLASTVFLFLCMIHAAVYRKNLNGKRWLLLSATLTTFVSGVIGLVSEQMTVHRVMSAVLIILLAIHIFVFHKNGRE